MSALAKLTQQELDARFGACAFSLIDTGGCCQGWERSISKDHYLFVTDDATKPEIGGGCVVALNTHDHSEQIISAFYERIEDALLHLERTLPKQS